MSINKDELTKEMIEKAMKCKTAEELADIELDGETLKKVSGGAKVCYNVLNCWTKVRNN